MWTFESVEADQVPSQTFLTIDETIHGKPGFVSFHGRVDIAGRAYPLAGQYAYVVFEREVSPGNYVPAEGEPHKATLNAAGEYAFKYWGVGNGNWRARASFPGNGPLKQSESSNHPVEVRSGYRFKFRHSEKCLTTSNNGTSNGTPLIQWTCGSGNPYDGQVFSLWPIHPPGSNNFQLRPNTNTGQCVDVYGADPANGALLKLYQCIPGAANQVWNIIALAGQPQPPRWFASIAQHSGRCMNVYGAWTDQRGRVFAVDCIWTTNEQWEWIVGPP